MVIRSVCVFCGSRFGENPSYKEAAKKLGKIFVEKGVTLVYGGGRIGLMGIISETIIDSGGEVIGIIPKFLEKLEIGNTRASELIMTDNMHVRKQEMFARADAFISMPGGIGTLEETLEIITWKQLKLHSKPIIVLNIDGYWSGLKNLIDNTVTWGFADPGIRDLIRIVEDPEDVFPALET